MTSPEWRTDLDALVFAVPGGGRCFVHRLAFRTLLGKPPAANDCLRFFAANSQTFLAAARARCNSVQMGEHAAFHLTSRQIRREMPFLTGSHLA